MVESLKATKRTDAGTHKARALRAGGKTPGIIYGHGQDNVAIALDEHDLDVAIHHGERLLEIDLGDAKENVLVKDVQFDTFGNKVLHVDLTRVNLKDRVEVTVPVVLRGTPAGATEGGVLQQQLSEVVVECVVTAIPDEIRSQVNDLGVGDSLVAADLELPEGAKLVTDGQQRICSISVLAEEEAAPAEEVEETVEPEVIGEKPAEEEESTD
ncbi:MAG: 50S ribosomal protein L25 [Planctomycetota bacterium]|jgi:large subunit ribosomal protein L25